MAKLFISFFAAFLIAVISPAVLAAPNATQSNFVSLVNTYRSWSGLPALTFDDNVSAAAQTLANECAYRSSIDYMDYRIDGRVADTALTDIGVQFDNVYYVVGTNYTDAQDYFMGLSNYAGANQSMLDRTYTRISLGIAYDYSGESYWYMILVDGYTPATLYPWASQYQIDFLTLLNTYRSWYGAGPLQLNGAYCMASATLSYEKTYYDYTLRPNGTNWWTAVEAYGDYSSDYGFWGHGYTGAQEVLTEFAADYHSDLVNPEYTQVGIACSYKYDGTPYWYFILG